MSVLQQNIAVISQTRKLTFANLQRMVAGVQTQMTRDYLPIWGRHTTVIACKNEATVPHGFWKAFIKDNIGEPGASGYHTDENHQPVIYVKWEGFNGTSVTLSHEVLEAATDPFGNRLISAMLPKVGRVRVLVEIADPPEAASYMIGDVQVSDFITPQWYDAAKHPGVRYSFLDSIPQPCTIIRGGYVSFIKPDGSWHQQTWFGGNAPKLASLANDDLRVPDESMREWVDRITTPKIP